jgi:hypothetical protein
MAPVTVKGLFLAIGVIVVGLLLGFGLFVACTAAILDVNEYPGDPTAPASVTDGGSGGSR